MKFNKKTFALAGFSALAVLSLASCGGKYQYANYDETGTITIPKDWTAPDSIDVSNIDLSTATDEELYNTFFGTYEDEMNLAKNAATADERYYHYAKAEAYALNEALFIPMTTQGGSFTITRVGIGSAPYALWGTDSDKLKYVGVATELVKAEDRQTMREKLLKEREEAVPYKAYSDGSHTTTYSATAELEKLGYQTTKTYNFADSQFPTTYDIHNTYRAADSTYLCNYYDYLVQYDVAGNIIPSLAESWTVSDDGLTWTFNIRQGVKWVDVNGNENSELTAEDFVYGMQRAHEKGYVDYMFDVLENGEDVIYDEKEFSELGVKAKSKYVLEFKLNAKTDYFLTYLTYNSYAPAKQTYVESNPNYGSSNADILYCGPFICSSSIAESSMDLVKNSKYWDVDNVTIDRAHVTYDEGGNQTQVYERAVAGTYAGTGLNAVTIPLAKKDGNFEKYAYVSDTNATTYIGQFNLNRHNYATKGYEDSTTSPKTAEQSATTAKAILNSNFRRAIVSAFDKYKYNAVSRGEEAALFNLRNTYVPYDYVSLSNDTEGYKAGTEYGYMVLNEMQKLGSLVTNVKDGINSYYNTDLALLYLEKALEETGIDETIYLDYPCAAYLPTQLAAANVIKQTIETALQGKVIVNVIECSNIYAYYYSNYYVDDAKDANYDFDFSNGWGPDYGDPLTYMSTFGPNGDLIKNVGINAHDSTKY